VTTRPLPPPGDGPIAWDHADSPIGRLLLLGDGRALTGLHLADHVRAPKPTADWVRRPRAFSAARRELDEWFTGRRSTFTIPLRLDGTPFQVAVWTALRQIPYGTTTTYGEVATRLGRPAAHRAVGAANGRNPISVIVPCHRLVGADGSLTGYGWGVERKAWLLAHERDHVAISGSVGRPPG
jgi:methylated-DNA-[protein]-cysteine S-methyltransferase